MQLPLISVLAIAVTFVGVQAQTVSPCVVTCITQAASANGCTLTDTKCLCTNTPLQQAALTCLQTTCTAQDQQNAESLVNTECAAVVGSSIIPAASSTAPGGSASASGASTSIVSTTSSGAAASQTSNAAASTALAGGTMGAAALILMAVGAAVGL